MQTDNQGLDQPEAPIEADATAENAQVEEAHEEVGESALTAEPAEQETLDEPAAEEPSTESPPEPAELTDEELFLAAINGDVPGTDDDESFLLRAPQRNEIITGVIASINESEILVDIGAKSEGIISGQELAGLEQSVLDSLEVGQEIEVFVVRAEGREGQSLLSIRRALEEQDWVVAEDYLQRKENYKVEIIGYNKGGLIVTFGKVRGFVPASQVSANRRRRASGTTPDDRWNEMIGEEMSVKVIEVDRSRNRLILSERAAMREKREEMRQELMENLNVGDIHTGRVTSLTDFGAFVDLGGIDGLVHLSELAWEHITNPAQVLSVGDEIEVEVIDVDTDRQRIGLSRKRRLTNPWDRIEELYEVDQLVQGVVTKLTKFGAFARLVDQPAIEGLIHISELADHRIGHPREVVEEGQTLTLRVVRIEPDKRRIGLSLKKVDSVDYLNEDWQDLLGNQ